MGGPLSRALRLARLGMHQKEFNQLSRLSIILLSSRFQRWRVKLGFPNSKALLHLLGGLPSRHEFPGSLANDDAVRVCCIGKSRPAHFETHFDRAQRRVSIMTEAA